jgi:hypothetical protein
MRLLEWLETQLSDGPHDSLLVRHAFPLESFDLPPGWISGLTQGRVAEAFLQGWKRFVLERYRTYAERLLKVFTFDVKEGGLLAHDADGNVCIEEFPTNPPLWALNGIGSAIASLENVAHEVGVHWSNDTIERVRQSMQNKIRMFDYPDYPGSKVQLTLKHRIGFRWEPKPTAPPTVPAEAVEVSVPDPTEEAATAAPPPAAPPPAPTARVNALIARPPLSEPYAMARFDANGAEIVSGKILWFDALLDGNHNSADDSAPRTTRLELSVDAEGDGRLALLVKDGVKEIEALAFDLAAGTAKVAAEVDWSALIERGVGRVAKFDEYYHETNLVWMWRLAGYGALAETLHVARRWLWSFTTGRGRLPFPGEEVDLSQVEKLLAADDADLAILERWDERSPKYAAKRTKVESLRFLTALLRGEVEPECVYLHPKRIVGRAAAAFSVYGYGFHGDERVELAVDGTALPQDAFSCASLSGDEIVVRFAAARTGGVMDVRVVAASGALIGPPLRVDVVT